MATLTVCNLDETDTALAAPAAKTVNLTEAIRLRFADLGGVELADTSEFRAMRMREYQEEVRCRP